MLLLAMSWGILPRASVFSIEDIAKGEFVSFKYNSPLALPLPDASWG